MSIPGESRSRSGALKQLGSAPIVVCAAISVVLGAVTLIARHPQAGHSALALGAALALLALATSNVRSPTAHAWLSGLAACCVALAGVLALRSGLHVSGHDPLLRVVRYIALAMAAWAMAAGTTIALSSAYALVLARFSSAPSERSPRAAERQE